MSQYQEHGRKNLGTKPSRPRSFFSPGRIGFWVLLLIVLAAGALSYKYNQYLSERSRLNFLLGICQKDLNSLEDIGEIQEQLEQLALRGQASYKRNLQLIPPRLGVESFMAQLGQIAAARGCAVFDYESSEVNRGDHQESVIRASLRGPPEQLSRVWEDRKKIGRLVTWHEKDLSGQQMDLTMSIYSVPMPTPKPLFPPVETCGASGGNEDYWFWNSRLEDLRQQLASSCETLRERAKLIEPIERLNRQVEHQKILEDVVKRY